jgi:opacity protein-like surface antigen
VAGAAFALNESIAIFGEAQYRFLEVDGVKVDGRRIDTGGEKAKLSGLGVNVGLRFSF